jgi:hypothetical protein
MNGYAMKAATRKQRVLDAIEFRAPERVPVVFWNCNQDEGDVMVYHLSLGVPGDGSVNAIRRFRSKARPRKSTRKRSGSTTCWPCPKVASLATWKSTA